MKFQRGAVIVETALTVGIGLTILLFSVQVGLLGFLQVTADAASFVDARAHSVGTLDAAGPEDATTKIFPQIAPSDIVNSPVPAPSELYSINYGNHGGWGTWTGVSIMQPLLSTSVVTPHGSETHLGQVFKVSGQDIEPQWVECAPHFDVMQWNLNAQCGAAGGPTNANVNYFTQGENTPPFFLALALRPHCILAQPWSGCMSAARASYWNLQSMGLAEFLDVNNWAAANGGANGTGTSGGQPVSTFEYMACHQRVYANLAIFLNSIPSILSGSQQYSAAYNKGVGYPSGTGISDFRNWNEFSTTVGTPSTADNLVREIYNWDAYFPSLSTAINPAVEPGGTPLHYGQGC